MSCTYILAGILVVAITTSGVAASATSCVNVTLSNILGIGNCIGDSTNFCSSANCAIQGISRNGSPQGIIGALLPLLLIPASRDIPNMSSGLSLPFLGGLNLGALNLGGLNTGGLSMASLIRNDSCNGSINIGLPAMGNIGNCSGDMMMMCTAGSSTTTNMIQSEFQALACILRQLPVSQFTTAFRGIGCPLLQAANTAAQGNLGLQMALMGIRSTLQMALGLQCPTLPSLPIG
ncbi:uncharacterized protein LOC119452534 isoform X2 [Dermacentor silvarum]|uniref:uncharacterized protein LOC119452534 isoform X2 n=1 Tax=Dermacentor silvarum TaxID=543639 RepID=UPI002100FA2C|nr:uncharacterized protein LOC119452534 isoform X2 [Dermacentor silvarum]